MHFLSISDNCEELRKPVYNSRHFLHFHVLVYEQFVILLQYTIGIFYCSSALYNLQLKIFCITVSFPENGLKSHVVNGNHQQKKLGQGLNVHDLWVDDDGISDLLFSVKSGMPECAKGLVILPEIPLSLLLPNFPVSCKIKQYFES